MNSGSKKYNTIHGLNVLQPGNQPVLNSEFSFNSSKDIVPVHSSTSKSMACQKEISKSSISKNLYSIEDCKLSYHFNEKCDLSNPKYEINGANIITTDAEVHHRPTETKTSAKEKYLNETKSKVKNIFKISDNVIVSQEGLTSSPPSSQKSIISNNIPSSSNIQNETNCILKSKDKIHDSLCNGYSVSEATSSNIIAVSDLSASSEKLYDSFVSSSMASKQFISGPSQSQHQCDNNSSFGSNLYKIPDINLNPLLTSVELPPYTDISQIIYVNYENENQMSSIIKLIQKDLSEPYSIYTYRYFIHNWPKLCFLAIHNSDVVGAIVCKLDMHKKTTVRGYIAMLAVDEKYRKKKIGSNLVLRAIRAMAKDDADEVVLETEITNLSALKLYENLGFVRDKRLFRYYLNGVDALRLKLWLR